MSTVAKQETHADTAARLLGCIKAHLATVSDSRRFQPWPESARLDACVLTLLDVPLEVFDAMSSRFDHRGFFLGPGETRRDYGVIVVNGLEASVHSESYLPIGKHADRVKS